MDYSGLGSLTKLTTKMYILHLVEMVLVLPISAPQCEPAVSAQNQIKGSTSRA